MVPQRILFPKRFVLAGNEPGNKIDKAKNQRKIIDEDEL
jgi:hypothetical protein